MPPRAIKHQLTCRWWDSNLQPLGYKPSALAIELYSSKAIAGKELSLFSWCIASLYIYHFSIGVGFSSEKYSGSTGHRNSWYQWRNFQWGCRWWDSNSKPLGYKPSALAIELYNSKVIAGKELSLSNWCIASLYLFIISQMWLTSHLRSTVVLLDTGTPETSGEIFSEDADGQSRTRSPSVTNRVL